MKIKIDQKNEVAIEKALAAVNGKAAQFTIDSLIEIEDIIEMVEEKLAAARLPKKSWVGIRASYIPEGPYANAYKYAAISTQVFLLRGSSTWFLTGVLRAQVYPKRVEKLHILISGAQADDINRKALEPFEVAHTK